MIFAVIPLLLYLVDNVYDFQSFLDQEGIYSILDKLNGKNQGGYAKYIKSEMMFFWAGAFITSLLIPIRMIVSLWRMRHRNTV